MSCQPWLINEIWIHDVKLSWQLMFNAKSCVCLFVFRVTIFSPRVKFWYFIGQFLKKIKTFVISWTSHQKKNNNTDIIPSVLHTHTRSCTHTLTHALKISLRLCVRELDSLELIFSVGFHVTFDTFLANNFVPWDAWSASVKAGGS